MKEAVLAGAPGAGKTTLWGALAPRLREQRWGRGIRLLDTPGLGGAPDPDPARRRLQAQAIRWLLAAPLLLHVIDASRTGGAGSVDEVDRELALLGRNKAGYAVLATHMDGAWAATGLQVIRQHLAPPRLFPVVAPAAQGLVAVRQFLRAHA